MAGPRPGRSSGQRPGRLFGAITVVPAMLAAGWLLPGLPLVLWLYVAKVGRTPVAPEPDEGPSPGPSPGPPGIAAAAS